MNRHCPLINPLKYGPYFNRCCRSVGQGPDLFLRLAQLSGALPLRTFAPMGWVGLGGRCQTKSVFKLRGWSKIQFKENNNTKNWGLKVEKIYTHLIISSDIIHYIYIHIFGTNPCKLIKNKNNNNNNTNHIIHSFLNAICDGNSNWQNIAKWYAEKPYKKWLPNTTTTCPWQTIVFWEEGYIVETCLNKNCPVKLVFSAKTWHHKPTFLSSPKFSDGLSHSSMRFLFLICLSSPIWEEWGVLTDPIC